MAEHPGYNGDGNDIVKTAERHAKSRLRRYISQLVWLVPTMSVLAGLHSAIMLGWLPEPFRQYVEIATRSTTRLDPQPHAVCLALSVITLVYWGAREGKPWFGGGLKRALIGGLTMLTDFKEQLIRSQAAKRAKRHAKERAKGHATGYAEGITEGIARGRALERQAMGLPPEDHSQNEDAPQ